MPRITLKETITKEIDIPLEALCDLIDNLSQEERESVLNRLRKEPAKFKVFQKDKIELILGDFKSTNIYEDDFLTDLKEGLKKSSLYSK